MLHSRHLRHDEVGPALAVQVEVAEHRAGLESGDLPDQPVILGAAHLDNVERRGTGLREEGRVVGGAIPVHVPGVRNVAG